MFDLVQDIPSDVSGSLPHVANIALIHVNSNLRETTGSNAIPENRQSVVTSLTCALAMSRMQNIGVDFSYGLGDLRIDKGQSSGAAQQVSFFLQLVNAELHAIPKNRASPLKSNG